MTTAQHLNPFHVRHVTLTTRHSPSTCAERLRAEIAPFWNLWPGPRALKGRVSEERFSVSLAHGGGRSLPSEARGAFVAGGMGTSIETSIGWRRVDSIGFGLALVGSFVVPLLAASESNVPGWLLPLIPLVVGVAFVLHRMSTLNDDERLIEQLSALLEASALPESS